MGVGLFVMDGFAICRFVLPPPSPSSTPPPKFRGRVGGGK